MKWETFFCLPRKLCEFENSKSFWEGGSRRLTDEASPSIDSKSVNRGQRRLRKENRFIRFRGGKETGFFTVTPHQSRLRRDSFPTGEA